VVFKKHAIVNWKAHIIGLNLIVEVRVGLSVLLILQAYGLSWPGETCLAGMLEKRSFPPFPLGNSMFSVYRVKSDITVEEANNRLISSLQEAGFFGIRLKTGLTERLTY
jgi:hypothetical protein